jgi:hypothetical protein
VRGCGNANVHDHGAAVKTFVWIVQALFVMGVAGCGIAIPMCAWKFFSVVFESNDESEAAEAQANSDPRPAKT